MNVIEISVDKIKPYKKNAKKHTDKQIETLMKSIELTKGLKQPVVIDSKGVLVAGHGRLEAAKRLGYETIPCVIADDMTKDEIKLFRLLDNRVAQGEIDINLEFDELKDIDLDISAFNFDLPQLELDVEKKEQQHQEYKEETQFSVRNILNLEKGQFYGVGKYDMPLLEPVTELPPIKEWIGFNYVLSDKEPEGKAVHFFVDDYQFERVWNNPEKYLDKLKQYVCVATPDFSPYENMPHVLQLMSHYKKQWVGRWLQYHGVTVIPTIRPVLNRDWWLDGIPECGIYISSAMWSKDVETSTEENSEYDKIIIDRLKPKKMFMYRGGGDNLYRKYGIECEYIKSFAQTRWGNANK